MMKTKTEQRFVSEPIKPKVETADLKAMSVGGPGLPQEFIWRGKKLSITAVHRTWRETGSCKHGSSESYARKHWFDVETSTSQRARIYFERQPRGKNRMKRWWLFSIEDQKENTKY